MSPFIYVHKFMRYIDNNIYNCQALINKRFINHVSKQ